MPLRKGKGKERRGMGKGYDSEGGQGGTNEGREAGRKAVSKVSR